MADDPIKETSDALASVFAQPKGAPNDPDRYRNGTADPANPVLVGSITTLPGVLYGASPDMAAIGASVRQALTYVAKQIKP